MVKRLNRSFVKKVKKRYNVKKPKYQAPKKHHKYIRKERKTSKSGKSYWKYYYPKKTNTLKRKPKYTRRERKTNKNGKSYWKYYYNKKPKKHRRGRKKKRFVPKMIQRRRSPSIEY